MPGAEILSVKNLKKYFPIKAGTFIKKTVGFIKAVDDVSFSVRQGETLGIVGESGCGKSTMGKVLIRLLEPSAGEIRFNGYDITQFNAQETRRMRSAIQMIFQDPYASLNPRMTVGKIIEEPLIIKNIHDDNERREIVEDYLKIVGLDKKHYDYYPHEFSGGQRQRVAIARALVTRPKLIVADEAVSALDVSIQAQILNLMKDLQKKYGLTYIFISHNLSVIRYISNRIGVMYLGHMLEIAATDSIFNEAMHPYTRGLLEASPRLDRRRSSNAQAIIGMEIPSASNPPSGCVFHTRCPYCQEICTKERPLLKEVKDKHLVACHFAGKI